MELVKEGRNGFYFACGTPDRLAGVPLMVGWRRFRTRRSFESYHPLREDPGEYRPGTVCTACTQSGFGLKPVDAVASDVGAHIVRSRQ
jgi:hypothetical protein